MSADILLVDSDDLRPTHLVKYPVWVLCDLKEPFPGHGHDQWVESNRAHPIEEPLPRAPGGELLIVRARFTLADGDVLEGAVTVTKRNQRHAHALHPMVRLNKRSYQKLWLEEWQLDRLDDMRARLYGHLGKTPAQVFPLEYSVEPGLLTLPAAGRLTGFHIGLRRAPWVREEP
jgi:hypothetical protein